MTEWLFDTLLATTALMALVLVLREPVRRRFGSAVAYALWLIPAARLLMPTISTTVERSVVAPTPSMTPPGALSLDLHQPYAMSLVEPSLLDRIGGWSGIALFVWLLGGVLMLARGAVLYRKQRRAVLCDASQLARLGGVRIVRSHAVRGPLAFGVIDRVIALPDDFDERFDVAQRRLALDHELAHHRSGDIIANHVAFVLLCLQWFNPLAWMSHAAFRFDQEAACDARVLDRAKAEDRVAYGQAIAKAASGRALLFSGALDRPSTLQRRLKSMLVNPEPGRRRVGQTLIVAGLAMALPLTATWATRYVDVPAPPAPPAAPAAARAPLAPIAPASIQAPLAPVAPKAPVDGDRIMINGKEKDWRDLTPAERAEIRSSIAKARAEIAAVDFDEVEREVANAMAEVRIDRTEMRRDLAEARAEVREAFREIDANADEIRKAGQDPETIKATVRASLKAVEAIDIDAITREALASVDKETMRASMAAARAGLRQAQEEIDRLDRRTRD
jgi:beta-lactamase regulating signal transducer with metallopeptidase domain